MKTVLLVRHGTHAQVGHVLSGRSEIALNAQGRAEAEALADRLEGRPLASLHCSPRRRAQETIAPLARRLGLPVRTTDALDEIDFGRFTGRRFDALDAEDEDWHRWNSARNTARCPGGETMGEAIARARAYLLALPATAAPALCVTHCDIIRGLMAEAMGEGLGRLLHLECAPGSVTPFHIAAGVLRLGLNAPVAD